LDEIKADVNLVGGYYGTVLQAAAAASGEEKIVKLLLMFDANMNAYEGQ
jgi:hypothetical protein